MKYVAGTTIPIGDFTSREITVYQTIFNEELDRHIPAMLQDIWDEKKFIFHELPKVCGSTLELYGGVDGDGKPAGVTRIEIGEYADFRELPAVDPGTIIGEVKELAIDAAESYAWNVRNAFLKGGRMIKGFSTSPRLHLTDWKNEFHINVAMAAPSCCNEDSKFKGWVAFRYRFVAAKI